MFFCDSAEQKSLNKELQQYWKLSAKVQAHTVAIVLGHEKKRPDLLRRLTVKSSPRTFFFF